MTKELKDELIMAVHNLICTIPTSCERNPTDDELELFKALEKFLDANEKVNTVSTDVTWTTSTCKSNNNKTEE